MKENKLRSTIVASINKSNNCHASPIESEVSPGFPDINMVLLGVEMNAELKTIRGPEGSYEVEPTQIGWGKARAKSAGIVLWVLVIQAPYEVFITLGCPHTGSGKFKFDRKTWTDAENGCVVYEGEPKEWARALFAAAQSFAP